jgi:hypothetical protein
VMGGERKKRMGGEIKLDCSAQPMSCVFSDHAFRGMPRRRVIVKMLLLFLFVGVRSCTLACAWRKKFFPTRGVRSRPSR